MTTPKHIAFIMDGNRRWARKNQLKTIMGHHKGVDRIEEVVRYAKDVGVSHVTFWAFSTENWNRSKSEVEDIMNVFRHMLNGDMFKKMMENGVRALTIGEISAFPEDIYKKLVEITNESQDNTGITAIFALNYGGRTEILRAVNQLLEDNKKNITEFDFQENLYTSRFPDPDLIIRTGGEKRLSGYLPWQSTYSELYFTECLWPDFDQFELQKSLDDYTQRERRFGS